MQSPLIRYLYQRFCSKSSASLRRILKRRLPSQFSVAKNGSLWHSRCCTVISLSLASASSSFPTPPAALLTTRFGRLPLTSVWCLSTNMILTKPSRRRRIGFKPCGTSCRVSVKWKTSRAFRSRPTCLCHSHLTPRSPPSLRHCQPLVWRWKFICAIAHSSSRDWVILQPRKRPTCATLSGWC